MNRFKRIIRRIKNYIVFHKIPIIIISSLTVVLIVGGIIFYNASGACRKRLSA